MPWACELDVFRLLICTTRTRNVFVVQVRRMRMYLFCARASSLVRRIALHNRFDGAPEVSNVGLARLAESRALVIVVVPEHRCGPGAAEHFMHALNVLLV